MYGCVGRDAGAGVRAQEGGDQEDAQGGRARQEHKLYQ